MLRNKQCTFNKKLTDSAFSRKQIKMQQLQLRCSDNMLSSQDQEAQNDTSHLTKCHFMAFHTTQSFTVPVTCSKPPLVDDP